ncbi:mediator of DNA damage checkpoint protein 1 [Morone saxatilis]|uniref:mediator of DNA damage checkpoint protein 1 n=1 Tax=Morone saxatilis TaxID=34816 RepID=UPI0015E1C754|nr:mediator of DNA damage checkpoint protein 1 [Morone saxatilis]XP_035528454.1 mediator of DNA damage checkpoint protein 1 [Morone saxatilis]
MDATQMISDSILESDEEDSEEESEAKRGRPLAKLCILKNEHIPETELPLFLGENVLGRDPNTCTLLLPASSISKQHATICISVYGRRGCHSEGIEALVWDLGSMNGTRKGRLKLTPNVRYALSECDSLVVADIPCQYVSCAADTVSSQGDLRTHVSRTSGVKDKFPGALGEKEGDTRCVNEGTKAKVSLPDLEDTRKTPVRTSCLSFEQTPTQPQGTLVPESDLDSDGERGVERDRRRKALVSDSDSYKSSPTCSTFLSPTNKIVPESEDESPITPSSSTKNRPHRHVSFGKETDVDVARQQLKEKKPLVIEDDSEEEKGKDEERAALAGREAEESGQHVPVKQENNVSLIGEDELPVSTPAVFTNSVPAFNMDSDTDVEGEEEGVASVGPVTLNTNQQSDQPPNTAQFHMDSDTDVDDDDDTSDKVLKAGPSFADNTRPPHVISVIQPEGITMDSDTDVDDDDAAAVSDAASKEKPMSFQSADTADTAPSTQLKDFHLDSDTDVDEEEENECRTINTSSKIDETPTRLDIKPIGPESAPSAPHSLHLDSDTDDEGIPAPAIGEPSLPPAVTESRTTVDIGADLDILSDSDRDSPLVIPFVATTLSFVPDTMSETLQSDSDADTDVDESSMPPAEGGVNPANLSVDSDTDVEGEEVDFGGAGEGQIPSLRRGNTPGLLGPLLQNCSTPVQMSEGEMEDMETQSFVSPSSGPFRRTIGPAVRPKALSSCSDSQEDEDFVVAETQSFVLQTRDCQGNHSEDHTMDPTQDFHLESSGDEKGQQSSRGGSFQLGLSDSSHLQGQAQALAMESTQAFASVEGGVNLEDTHAYAAISNEERSSLENDSNLEATQAYGENEESDRCSATSVKEGQVDLALEATQAYISEPHCDSDDDDSDKTDDDERKNTATSETQPLDFPTSSTVAMAETQPMSAFEEEESLDKENPVSSVLQVKPRAQTETAEREKHGEGAQLQGRHLSEALSLAETQPMPPSVDEESDDEDSIPGPRKRKAQSLQLEEEQTQPLTGSELSLVETQPMHIGVDEAQPMSTSENGESNGGKKAKQLWLEEKPSQTLTNSDISAAETQSMNTGKDGESDEEELILGPRKRKVKPLQFEEDQTQTLTNSQLSSVETQPMDTGEHGESDEEDSIPGPRKRKAKPLHFEEEQTQSLTSCEVSAVETQPIVTGGDRESDEEDSIPGRRKRKAKPLQTQEEDTQPLTNSEASTVETLPLETKADLQPQREKERLSEAGPSRIAIIGKRGTRARLKEEEKQAEFLETPKRETRGKNRALPTTRGRRGKPRPDKDESEEEEVVEQAKRARGKKSVRQKKDGEEKETERNMHENNSLIKEQEELGEEKEQMEESQHRREEQEKLERERKEKEEQERLQAEKAEGLRLEREQAEKETIERERKEQEEKERADRTQKDKEEQLLRERKEKEERGRLEREKAERVEKERLEREEKARIEKERKEQEEKERLETAKRELEQRLEREEQEKHARLEREAKEREERGRLEKEKQEKEAKEKQIKEQQENKATRGQRAARRTIAAPCTTEPEQDSTISTNDDVPARRTRSRSNSSNSVNSERSASSVNTQESRGRGRGRGAKRTSEPPRVANARSSNRRRTVAAEPTEQDSNDISPQGVLLGSNSNNSLNSEISSSSLSSQSRGRGGRQRGRGRKTEVDSIPPINSQSDQNSAPKPTARGRKSRKTGESTNAVPHEDDKETVDSQQASTTRGRQRANANSSEPAAADEEDPSNQGKGHANEESLLPKRNVRGRGQKAVEIETVEAPVPPAVSDGDEEKRKGRKRELEPNTEEDSSSSSKISKGKEKAQMTKAAEETKGVTKDKIPVQAKTRGRASSAQAKKNAKDSPTEVEVKEESEKMEEEAVERRGRGRPSTVQKKRKEEQEESGTSVDQNAHVEASEPQTPTSSVSRKRRALADSSPVTKTPRSCSASPAASGRLRAASQAFKVLFTGVVDEAGERVLARLGGSMANGVADMNFLVTDKVRRTVKFLCAVAKGVPIVTTHWLEKSGKAGSFLSPNAFVVKDLEQEKKFCFCLQESLRIASSQPLLQGYEIHVTKSVKPEPVQMKDIITCSGATFLAKMPSSHKPQTVVISCEEDWSLCGPARSACLPVVTAEFILTGILQQKLDFQTHSLCAPTSNLQAAGGRGRSRKKT